MKTNLFHTMAHTHAQWNHTWDTHKANTNLETTTQTAHTHNCTCGQDTQDTREDNIPTTDLHWHH